MKGWVEEPSSKKLGGPWGAIILGEYPRLGVAPVGAKSTGLPCTVEPFTKKMKPG
jgi:hypothetical protein